MTVSIYVEFTALEDFYDFLNDTESVHLDFSVNTLKEYVSISHPQYTSMPWVQVNLDKHEWAKTYNELF
jgi:hypothetical protein